MPSENSEELKALATRMEQVVARLDQLVASHNQVGENVAWLTANTQGIFQMLNDPRFISQMMSGMLSGGVPGDGPQA